MKLTKYTWISLGLLLGISALAYLPFVNRIGYMNDDWYLMYDGLVHGAGFFHNIFGIDRPLRGYVMQGMFSVFGLDPLSYHISAYIFRLLSGIGFLWVCNLMWPRLRVWNLMTTTLFLIYPGFLSQVNPIDYQSQFISLACGMFSVALSIKAVQTEHLARRWIYTALSIFLAWIYLGLVEYFIGFEALRLVCIAILFLRNKAETLAKRLWDAAFSFMVFMIGAGGFLVWRLFFFSAERKATDIGIQLSSLFSSPLTGLWWLNYLIQDVFKVVFGAWVTPLNIYAFSLRLRDAYIGFGIASIGVMILAAAFIWLRDVNDVFGHKDNNNSLDIRESASVAVVAILAGLIPVIIVNRHVVFPDLSRYALASSVGVAILFMVCIRALSSYRTGMLVVSVLVFIGILTHHGNSVKAALDTEVVQNFWWQVAWRVPQIENGTTLSVTYPDVAIQEDYFIWGAANHIYYPEPSNDLQVQLPALVLNDYTVSRILAERGEDSYRKRGGVLVINEYDKVLILTQAARDSCVRVLNGNSPDLSAYDQHRVMVVAPYSKLDTVIVKKNMPVPTKVIFGSEPLHEWCYYYQKADLARQLGNWDEVARLGDEAQILELHPNDQIEWMPFLQAYAFLGKEKQVKELSTRINTVLFYSQQACRNLSAMTERGYPLTAEMQAYVDELFCQ